MQSFLFVLSSTKMFIQMQKSTGHPKYAETRYKWRPTTTVLPLVDYPRNEWVHKVPLVVCCYIVTQVCLYLCRVDSVPAAAVASPGWVFIYVVDISWGLSSEPRIPGTVMYTHSVGYKLDHRLQFYYTHLADTIKMIDDPERVGGRRSVSHEWLTIINSSWWLETSVAATGGSNRECFYYNDNQWENTVTALLLYLWSEEDTEEEQWLLM